MQQTPIWQCHGLAKFRREREKFGPMGWIYYIKDWVLYQYEMRVESNLADVQRKLGEVAASPYSQARMQTASPMQTSRHATRSQL